MQNLKFQNYFAAHAQSIKFRRNKKLTIQFACKLRDEFNETNQVTIRQHIATICSNDRLISLNKFVSQFTDEFCNQFYSSSMFNTLNVQRFYFKILQQHLNEAFIQLSVCDVMLLIRSIYFCQIWHDIGEWSLILMREAGDAQHLIISMVAI